MPMRQLSTCLSIVALLTVFSANLQADQNLSSGSDVRVVKRADGSFTLLRNGEPYLVRGAGTRCGHGPGGHASEDALSPYLPEGFDHAPWGADVTLQPLNLCVEFSTDLFHRDTLEQSIDNDTAQPVSD